MSGNLHDRGYKGIFQKPDNFVQLLKGFIHEKWAEQVKPEDLMLINKEFILPDFTGKEADIVYRAVLDGQEVIFYLLLELQSTVDNSIPARLLVYMTEIIRQSFSQTDKNVRMSSAYRIPAVIPIVIYNGDTKWTPPLNFRDYQNKGELFGNNIIDFTYILLNTKSFSDEELSGIGSLVSIIFMLDHRADKERTARKLITASKLFRKLTSEQQAELISWLRNILMEIISDNNNSIDIDAFIQSFERGETDMRYGLLESLDQIKNDGIEKGIEQGIKRVLKNLAEKGYSDEEMASLASISVDEVKKLLSE